MPVSRRSVLALLGSTVPSAVAANDLSAAGGDGAANGAACLGSSVCPPGGAAPALVAKGGVSARPLADQLGDYANARDYYLPTDRTFSAAFGRLMSSGRTAWYLPQGTYDVHETIVADNRSIQGEGPVGGTTIRGLKALAVAAPIINWGRSGALRDLAICYEKAAVTGNETSGERVGLATDGKKWRLERAAVVDRLSIDNVGTGIVDQGFSATYGAIEIGAHAFAGIQNIDGKGTGNVWENVYINGGGAYSPQFGVDFGDAECGGFIGQLNIEHQKYAQCAVRIYNRSGFFISSLHLEGIDVADHRPYVMLERTSGRIENLSIINSRMSGSGIALVQLGASGYGRSLAVGGARSSISRLSIGTLNTQGLADPNRTLYPDYPAEQRGIGHIVGFEFFRRDGAFADRDYELAVGAHEWNAYPGRDETDAELYAHAWQKYSNKNKNIYLVQFGRLTGDGGP